MITHVLLLIWRLARSVDRCYVGAPFEFSGCFVMCRAIDGAICVPIPSIHQPTNQPTITQNAQNTNQPITNNRFYFVYHFMLLVYLILLVVSVCTTIVAVYFVLNAENYHWQVRAVMYCVCNAFLVGWGGWMDTPVAGTDVLPTAPPLD